MIYGLFSLPLTPKKRQMTELKMFRFSLGLSRMDKCFRGTAQVEEFSSKV